ncbi:MAG TPA: hypothetical protein VHP35_01700, partial [Terriglobia bacterium]|nr:hypothetical protein [Terriglobia bacterium]
RHWRPQRAVRPPKSPMNNGVDLFGLEQLSEVFRHFRILFGSCAGQLHPALVRITDHTESSTVFSKVLHQILATPAASDQP